MVEMKPIDNFGISCVMDTTVNPVMEKHLKMKDSDFGFFYEMFANDDGMVFGNVKGLNNKNNCRK